MSNEKLASRYAKSLIDLAKEQDQLENVYNDVEVFSNALKNRDFLLMVKSPIINTSKKQGIMKSLFSESFNTVTASFLDIVVRKKREIYLPEIISSFLDQYKNSKGSIDASLVTASELTDELLNQVKGIIKRDTGRTNVELETKVDPSLIGGFILSFDDKLYNTSIAHKLNVMKKGFSENKYIKKY